MVRIGQPLFAALALASVVVASVMSGGCGNNNTGGTGGDNSSSGGSSSGDDSGSGFIMPGGSSSGSNSSGAVGFVNKDGGTSTPSCGGKTGWTCAVDTACASTSRTTLTGKVFDPAGVNPLYNVIVFIPNVVADLPIITPGTSTCNTCDSSIGDYVVATKTDADGAFTLAGVPTGTGVPVTVQIGKWRRTTTVNIPTSCATTKVSDGTLRLPAKRSEGDLPQMALLTGGCDDLACFLTNMGLDPSEFSTPMTAGGGRLDVYAGVGGAGLTTGTATACGATGTCPLWASKAGFEHYDIALFSCECGEETRPTAALQALHDWLNEGGKVFASHYHYTWFRDSPQADFKAVATWLGSSIAGTGGGTGDINATFPKGLVFDQWLGNVGALASAGSPPATPATISLQFVASSVSTVNTATTQQWIYDPATSPNDTKYLSFDTPIGGIPPAADAGPESTTKNYCGKAVFTDLHTGGNLFATANPVPSGCKKAPLSNQQKALEFLFFDLSACVTDDSQPSPPPPNQPQ